MTGVDVEPDALLGIGTKHLAPALVLRQLLGVVAELPQRLVALAFREGKALAVVGDLRFGGLGQPGGGVLELPFVSFHAPMVQRAVAHRTSLRLPFVARQMRP